MDKVIHFEIPADDVKRAEGFYRDVFGWMANSVPEMQYTVLYTGPTDKQNMPEENGFINGGMMRRGDIKNPVITIGVESIKETVEKIEKNGGRIIKKKMDVGDMGYAAYFQDPEGNIMGLWENRKK